MAMRPRVIGGGNNNNAGSRPRGTVRPVYEDFKPMSEWIQDQESEILLIYLPGFLKENLKVSTEGRNIIRVRGERLVAGNKWQRFLEDFHVPDYCNLRGTRARFEGGILTITVPRKSTSSSSSSAPNKEEAKPAAAQEQASSAAAAAQKLDDNNKQKQPISPPGRSNDPIPQKSQKYVPPKVASGQKDEPKAALESPVLPQKKTQDFPQKPTPSYQLPEKKIQQEAIPPKLTPSHGPGGDHRQKDDQTHTKPLAAQPAEKPPATGAEGQKPRTDAGATAHQKKPMESGGPQGPRPSETAAETTTNAQKRKPENDEGASSSGTVHEFAVRNYKKAIKSLAELDEERQLLVNAGAAVLVIVALGTYIYHTVQK